MKLIAIKPIYFEGNVLTEGTEFETLEQHGRELIKKGYAMLDESENPATQEHQQKQQQEQQQEQPEVKVDKKAKK